MTYPGLHPGARPVVAACFRQTRRRLAYVRQQEQQLARWRGFRREMVARTCARLRRETRLQLQAMRQLGAENHLCKISVRTLIPPAP